MTRRGFLASAALAIRGWPDRLGIMCQLGAAEGPARRTLAAAREAGFRHVQVNFPWDRVEPGFLRALPAWIRQEGLQCDVLSAYVNCLQPQTVLMATRAEDFARAIGYAGEIGAGRLIAWTGSYSRDLMKRDERNFAPGAQESIVRFLEPHLPRLKDAGLKLALETYITLACPDALSLRSLLDRLPPAVGAVLDPPNLTPPARYAERDRVLREMVRTLRGSVEVVHLKDFRLNADGATYQLPGPMKGEMNYPLFLELIRTLPEDVPVIAEHLAPAQFAEARRGLLGL